jgi:hypothetical protein
MLDLVIGMGMGNNDKVNAGFNDAILLPNPDKQDK